MKGLSLVYSYDISDCSYGYWQWTGDWESYNIDWWSGYTLHRFCSNPLSLIENHGQMEIYNFRIDLNVTPTTQYINATQQDRGYNFDDDGNTGFINNFGILSVQNLTMQDSLARYMFYNQGTV